MNQTNPEQWAVELWRKACHDYGGASIDDSPAEWRAVMAIQAAFAEQNARLVGALEGLIDDDPCWYDHHGYCQAHYVTSPCEMAEARATLAALKDRTHG